MNIKDKLIKLQSYIKSNNYKGYDPYDILLSAIFKLPFFNKNHKVRFLAQQLGKRSPINIRPILFTPKGLNPVTLGLCIQGYSYLYKAESDASKKQEYQNEIEKLISLLKTLIPQGFSGACWGYDFPWAARNASIPALQPTVVATGIISNGLFECYRITQNKEALRLCISAADFVLNDLQRTYINNSLCFSYSPFDKQKVFNASMKGVRLLAQVYSITGDQEVLKTARSGVEFLVNHQNADGSWRYSLAAKGNWVDNYHTGYNLDCLDEYIKCTGDTEYSENLKKGYEYYLNNFFEDGYKPKFYNNSLYPLDGTSAAQSLLTLCRFGDIEKANAVAEFYCKQMQNPAKGYFYFRKHKYYTQKTSFMRWSNAWMFAGLTCLDLKNNSQ